MARGYKISKVVKEVGSGLNDERPKLDSLLKDRSTRIIVIEHKNKLSRFGFNYIQTLLSMEGRKIEIVNESGEDKEDLMQDFVSIVTSFCARLYGLCGNRSRTEKLIRELQNEDK